MLAPTAQHCTTGFGSSNSRTDVPMIGVGATYIENYKTTTHYWCTQTTRKEKQRVRHPKCSAWSSLMIVISSSICNTFCSDIGRFCSSTGGVWQVWQPAECAVPHSTENMGTNRKIVDEVCRFRAQSRPLWPPAWHPHNGTVSPSNPVRRVRVGLHPCRSRSKTPWCG